MPAVRQSSALIAQLGEEFIRAWEENKGNEVVQSTFSADLPGGVSGIAQLTDFRFAQVKAGGANEGKWQVIAAGAVVSPESCLDDLTQQVVPCAGARTSWIEPLYDTPTRSRKTMMEHVKHVVNELKKLGVQTEAFSPYDVEGMLGALTAKGSRPYFRFHTWRPDEDPQDPTGQRDVRHFWDGACAAPSGTPAGTGGAVEEEGAPPAVAVAAPPRNGVAPRTNGAPVANRPVANRPAAAPSAAAAPPKAPAPATPKVPTPGPKPVPATPKASAPAPKPAPAAPRGMAKAPSLPAPAAEPFTEDGISARLDLDQLVADANNGDVTATATLRDAALGTGATEEEVDALQTWDEVAALIQAGGSEDHAPEDEANDATGGDGTPLDGDVYMYSPKGPGGKKGKAVEVEVLSVDAAKRTVVVRNLETNPPKEIKGVSWDALEGGE